MSWVLLTRFSGGKRWHLVDETTGMACRTKHPKRGIVAERVWVETPWDQPVLGNTCINCHPAIDQRLAGGAE